MSIAGDIINIANETRAWAEKYAECNGYSDDLALLCGVASGELHRRYKKALIRSTLAYNKQHCFVLVSHFVIDITATQFGHKEVQRLLGGRKVLIELYDTMVDACPQYYIYESKYNNAKDLLMKQKEGDWPPEQWVRVR